MTEHIGLKNLYKTVIENKYGWDRWGLVGVLSDCVLNYVSGDLLEIGICETSIFLSELAMKHNRKIYHCDYSKSLIENMKNTSGYFCENSVIYRGTSDDFFKSKIVKSNIAFGFIDGSHEYDIVKRDFWSMNELLVKDGMIVLHDSLPPDESWSVNHKCGQVYKLRIDLENDPRFDVLTFPFSAFNVGLTIIKRRVFRKWEQK